MDNRRSPSPRYSKLLAVLLMSLLSASAGANAIERLFAPKAERWAFWESRDPAYNVQIDHSVWNKFLGQYVIAGADGINRVQYSRVSDSDRQQLSRYIISLEQLPIRNYSADQQLAYWINLYNAVTVDVVLQHYPVSSIRDIDISPRILFRRTMGNKTANNRAPGAVAK